jgi:hypothetical protein
LCGQPPYRGFESHPLRSLTVGTAFARSANSKKTSSLDAKAELPTPKNADLAIDVAAMSTEGGVLGYGVAEDENELPTIPNPIALAGVGDRTRS